MPWLDKVCKQMKYVLSGSHSARREGLAATPSMTKWLSLTLDASQTASADFLGSRTFGAYGLGCIV